jgi:superfamily II DNA/RNA helicase
MGNFLDLGVDPFFAERLGERNIREPTEIQKQVIPLLAGGENIVFRSATGTGKTFAYLLPLFQRLFAGEAGEGGGPLMLICAPTYELCSQIKGEADFLLAAGPGHKVSLIIGSANMSRQIEALKKDRPAVVVGNPGRLLALARLGKLKLRGLKSLVLDEGDRLTADELFGETGELVKLISRGRAGDQTPCLMAACSATLSPKSRERLLSLMGGDARIVETEEQEILRDRIEHWAIFCEERRKIDTLRSLLAAAKPKKALIFSAGGAGRGSLFPGSSTITSMPRAFTGTWTKKAGKKPSTASAPGRSPCWFPAIWRPGAWTFPASPM